MNTMLNNRFTELARNPQHPFIYTHTYRGSFVSPIDMFVMTVVVDDDKVLEGFTELISELERAKRHGFHQSELMRAKSFMLSNLETLYKERNTTTSGRLTWIYVSHFLNSETMMNIEFEFALVRELFESIDINDINNAIIENATIENRMMYLTTPENAGVEIPTESDILALFPFIQGIELDIFPETLLETTLLENPPRRVRVRKPRFDRNLGTYTWKLRNGAIVRLKTTDFRSNEIIMEAYRRGGLSQAGDDIFALARNVHEVVAESGLGEFDKNQLDIYLSGKNVEYSTLLGRRTDYIEGTSSVADFETLMQILWLNFTAPRFDEVAVDRLKQQAEIYIRNRDRNPEAVFEIIRDNILYNNHLRMQPMQLEDLERDDHQAAFDFYRSRFSSVNGFNFTFVGNIDKDTLHRYIERYIAPLPSRRVDTRVIDRNVRFNQIALRENVYHGQDDKTIVNMIFTNDLPKRVSFREVETIIAFSRILTNILNEVVREKMSGVYYIYSIPNIDFLPFPQIAIEITFGCDPNRVEELIDAVSEQLNLLINNEFDEKYLHTYKETNKRLLEVRTRTNQYWANQIWSTIFFDFDPNESLRNHATIAENLTREDIANVAKKYIDFQKKIVVVLYPEDMKNIISFP
jgi:zinc protease